jgi:hypothetical protein
MAITYHAGRRIQSVPYEYKVHTFTTTGNSTFTVTGSGNVEYLIIAGGGGGGGSLSNQVGGGGGGAGGYRTSSSSAVTAQAYTVAVGGKGSGGSNGASGTSGSDSSFNSITSTGGGHGGAGNQGSQYYGGNGGSGGARATYSGNGANGLGNTPSTTPSQGNNAGVSGSNTASAGGGGSGSVGGDSATHGGVGGSGTASSISGSSVTYAGGGGGGRWGSNNNGAGGSGGGGAGGGNNATGYGSGGGGGQNTGTGGHGSDGIVIIRYKTSSGITATGGTITTINDHDDRPTDVQVGSRWEETDTRKMYHYSATLILEDDFSGSDSWTDRGTTIAVSTSNDRIDWDVGNGAGTNHDGTWYDLGAGVVNTTKWVLTAKIHVADWTANSASSCHIGVGLTDTNNVAYTTSQDSISLAIGVGTNDNRIYGHHSDSQEALDAQRDIFTITPSSTFASATSVWLKLVRNGSNTMIASLYSNEAMTTLLEEKTTTMAGTPANLRYIMVNGRQQNVNAMDGYVDDIKFYNGITTAESPVWEELGT